MGEKILRMRFIFVIILCGLIFTAVFFNFEMRQSLEETVIYKLENEIDDSVDAIDNYLYGMTELVRQMSIDPVFIDAILTSNSEDDVRSFSGYDDILTHLDDINASAPNLNLVWVGVKKANLAITSNRNDRVEADYIFTERPWYEEVIENGGLTYTIPYTDYFTQDEIITIAIPIYDNSEIVGVFGIDIEVAYIESLIDKSSFGSDSQIKLILDSSKEYHYELAKTDQLNENQLTAVGRIWDELNEHTIGVVDLSKYGIEKFLAYSELSVSNYRVLGMMDKSITNHQLSLLNNMTLSIIIAVLLAFSFLIYTVRIRKSNDSLTAINRKLEEREIELYKTNEEMTAAHQQLAASEAQLHEQFDDIKAYTMMLETMKAQFEMAVEFTRTTVWELNYENLEAELLLGVYTLKNQNIPIPKNMIEIVSLMFDKEGVESIKQAVEICRIGESDTMYCQVKYKDKDEWALIRGRTVDQEGTGNRILRGVILDITELKEHQAMIESQANTDYLTGLPNRRKFDTVLKEKLSENQSGAVLLLDLDNFKEINDTLGHAYGDEVLKAISKKLKLTEYKEQSVFRFGGDEFLFIIDHHTIEELEIFTEKLLDLFRVPIKVGKEEVLVNFSIGVSRFPEDGSSVNILLRNTDLAMYAVKELGKDNYKMFDKTLLSNIQAKSDIEKNIRGALDNNGFKLVYQPQVESISGEVKGYEALIRLKNNNYYPDQFIEVAETTGLILDIGRYVIREVVQYLAKLKVLGINMPIAINISPKQFNDKSLVDYLKDLLLEYDVSPELIDFEITESLLVEDVDEVIDFLEELKSTGIKISLDDFGTGYSSISYLTFLPIDKLKLDKSIIERFIEQNRQEVLKNIIEMAHNFDFKVVAEGVETKDQFHLLRSMSCDMIQGYYFSKPVDEIELQATEYKV